jgi:hypothetical protein
MCCTRRRLRHFTKHLTPRASRLAPHASRNSRGVEYERHKQLPIHRGAPARRLTRPRGGAFPRLLAVAVQVERESQTLKPGFHFFIGSKG